MPGRLDGLQQVATRLIEDFGGPATWTSVTRAFSATTGQTTETISATAVIATPPEPFKVGRVDGTVIQASDLSTLIKGEGLAPQVGDRLTKDGIEYQIVNVRPQSAGTVIAYYEIQLRT